MLNIDFNARFNRVILLVLGIAAVGLGLAPLMHGHLFYENSWGGPVFGPIAIIFGVVFILGALFKPSIFR